MKRVKKLKPYLKRFEVTKIKCVYFFVKDDEIVYIGKTIDLYNRYRDHKYSEYLNDADVYYLEVEDNAKRDDFERGFIYLLQPKYNISEKARVGTHPITLKWFSEVVDRYIAFRKQLKAKSDGEVET